MAPLSGLLVLDFSTLLPGPLASLMLTDAGAEVIKIERLVYGDEMRSYTPAVLGQGVNFALLNRGKSSIALDLKDPQSKEQLRGLLERADVIIEQFRPGVMARLGLGYDDVKAINPDIIYCSITGWGQTGPKALEAGHDLNYMAETGILGLSVGADGAPILPPILAADIAGGTYPAVVNILLALHQRARTGQGSWIDIGMGENLYTFIYWALGNAHALKHWPIPGGETVTGGTPRYQLYRTLDGRFIAAAPLEDKFWTTFTRILELPEALRDDRHDPAATRTALAEIIASRTAADWATAFAGQDVCCSIVLSLQEAMQDPHWQARRIFQRRLALGDVTIPALPSIVAPSLRAPGIAGSAPALGADTSNLAS